MLSQSGDFFDVNKQTNTRCEDRTIFSNINNLGYYQNITGYSSAHTFEQVDLQSLCQRLFLNHVMKSYNQQNPICYAAFYSVPFTDNNLKKFLNNAKLLIDN